MYNSTKGRHLCVVALPMQELMNYIENQSLRLSSDLRVQTTTANLQAKRRACLVQATTHMTKKSLDNMYNSTKGRHLCVVALPMQELMNYIENKSLRLSSDLRSPEAKSRARQEQC